MIAMVKFPLSLPEGFRRKILFQNLNTFKCNKLAGKFAKTGVIRLRVSFAFEKVSRNFVFINEQISALKIHLFV